MNKEEAIQILSTRDAHGVLCGYTSGYQEALDMAIEALRHDVIFEQIKWERDVALDTLEKHGIGLGQKYEPSTDAEEEVLHKILERDTYIVQAYSTNRKEVMQICEECANAIKKMRGKGGTE